MKEIIEPHKIKSREVIDADIKRVIEDAEGMAKYIGGHCVALAHSQVENNDPLRFFIFQNGQVIINPIITRHVNYTVDSNEGCMTYPDLEAKTKQRWHKIEVEYQTIVDKKLSEKMQVQLTGLRAFIFQHEINHFDAIYCYDHLD